jgi:hypothetical protein
VANENYISVLAISKKFNKSPSEILNIQNSYTAYCLDEASLVLINALENGKELNYQQKNEHKHYSSFADFYSQFN